MISGPQRRVLEYLAVAHKPTTDDVIDHVYGRVRGSAPATARVLAKLALDGLVDHQLDPADPENRAIWVITDVGRALLD